MHAPTRNYHSSAVRYHDYCYFNADLHACVFTHTLESNLDPNADEERNGNADGLLHKKEDGVFYYLFLELYMH